jgi:hypothetical protein
VPAASPDQLDLNDVRDVLLQAVQRVQALNGKTIPSASQARDRSAALAPIHRELLFVAHLADKARVGIMDEYHHTRGFDGFPDAP